MRALAFLALAAAVVLAGCAAPPAPPAGNQTTPPGTTPPPAGGAAIPSFAFTATDYNFTGPTSIPTGWVTLELRNQGREPHEMALLRIENHTYADFQAALQALFAPPPANASAGPPGPPDWVVEAGGVGGVGPGGVARVTQLLKAGTYALICFIPDMHGMPHAAHGMVKELTVTTTSSGANTPPTASVTVDMIDLNFTQQPDPPAAGNHTIRARNTGAEFHQTQLFGLQGNFTVQQLLAFFGEGDGNDSAPPPSGPPPFSVEGGLASIGPGGEGYFTATLQRGRYVYICFVDGHFAQGMVKEFTVA